MVACFCVGFLSSGDIFYEMAFSTTSSIFGYKESYELLWSFVATNHVMSLITYPRANCQLKRLERDVFSSSFESRNIFVMSQGVGRTSRIVYVPFAFAV